MKTKFIALTLVALVQPLAVFAATSTVQIQVNGMVCSFCAQGIEKKFKAEEAVENVTVKLEDHQVTLALKDGKPLTDEKIKSLLTDAGYTVEKIERN